MYVSDSFHVLIRLVSCTYQTRFRCSVNANLRCQQRTFLNSKNTCFSIPSVLAANRPVLHTLLAPTRHTEKLKGFISLGPDDPSLFSKLGKLKAPGQPTR